MKTYKTEVLVIGGGATGTGIIRDLAMRGLNCILVEKRDLSNGTTGRFHGLLHSGGRYVVKDPHAAQECIEENRILRKIMPQCLEDTGGFFVTLPGDDPDYANQFIIGCKYAGIPVEEISIKQMLHEEPNLNPEISRCFRVPDASADSFLASELNAASARSYNAEILTYHEVIKLIRVNNSVVGAECLDLVKDELVHILTDIVVLAAGAWSGVISSTIGIDIPIIPGKGSMIAVNHRLVNTIINRCKIPSNGDILVPIHSVSVMGTTDIKVVDPDNYSIDPWEIHLMLDEGEKIIPGFSQCRILRAWAGVRPLYQEASVVLNREVSRAFVLLDHAIRDGVDGLVTITSGKWTTYRKMAQATSDLVCNKFGIERVCKTHLEVLPESSGRMHHVGEPLLRIESKQFYGSLVCECELATYEDVVFSIVQREAKTIDDIRRDTRLGMGPCQGGYCSYRTTGIFYELRKPPVEAANNLLIDFLRERWKGLVPVLWGSQLRQERLNELIYQNVLNINRLPGLEFTRLGPTLYENPEKANGSNRSADMRVVSPEPEKEPYSASGKPVDVLVVGGGLSGLTCALITSMNNKNTRLITTGRGSLYWDSGCIDLFGQASIIDGGFVISPKKRIEELIVQNPSHPYSIIGIDVIHESLELIKKLSMQAGYPLKGTIERNWLLPTAVGAIRPTCLAPASMIAGDLNNRDPMLIVGVEGFYDFYPGLVSANLNSQGFFASHKIIRLASIKNNRLINSMTLARLFETEEFREEIIRAIKPILSGNKRIGLPSILGIERSYEAFIDLEEKLGCPIFEIPGLPPSIPGIRLNHILLNQISSYGGKVIEGLKAIKYDSDRNRLRTIYSEAAARLKPHHSNAFVLATGEFLGGGLRLNQKGEIQEAVFDLPIPQYVKQHEWFNLDFSTDGGHPIFRSGLAVNLDLQPINDKGEIIFNNLYAIGTILGQCDPVREISLTGIALGTGYKIGDMLSMT